MQASRPWQNASVSFEGACLHSPLNNVFSRPCDERDFVFCGEVAVAGHGADHETLVAGFEAWDSAAEPVDVVFVGLDAFHGHGLAVGNPPEGVEVAVVDFDVYILGFERIEADVGGDFEYGAE